MSSGLAPGSGRGGKARAPWTPQHPRAAPPAGASSGQWADWLFMIGPLSLLGIGLALVLGFTMRIAASAGVAMLVLMWSAVLPPANNPFMDTASPTRWSSSAGPWTAPATRGGSDAHTTDGHSCALPRAALTASHGGRAGFLVREPARQPSHKKTWAAARLRPGRLGGPSQLARGRRRYG